MSESDPTKAEVLDYARPSQVPTEDRWILGNIIGWLVAIGTAVAAILVLRWIFSQALAINVGG